jgi:hypothetical protein
VQGEVNNANLWANLGIGGAVLLVAGGTGAALTW